MVGTSWRDRVFYVLLSAFVGWHTVAMIVAPAPPASELGRIARAILQPYLTLFRIDSRWDFFAPSIGGNAIFRYVVKDTDGVGHTFLPMSKWSWLHPSSIWFHDWYDTVLAQPDIYGQSFGRLLCREHAALDPVSIVFQELKEREFRPEDLLGGKHPGDPEFLEVRPFMTVSCPKP